MNLKEISSTRKDGIIMTLIKGVLIGIANIIPGVSGGTFALILGIYPRILGALNSLGIKSVKIFLKGITRFFRGHAGKELANEWRRLDFTFLILLGIGMVAAILSSSYLIDYLLKEHHSLTLSFFIGLILPSITIPWSMLDKRGIVLLWAVPGILLTVGISFIMPDSAAGSDNFFIAIIIGAIAVSAMILPGLSGSYVMLIMGQYQNVLDKLIILQQSLMNASPDAGAILWLLSLLLGIIAGLILFAKFLNFLLNRFKNATMMFLIGLLIGSLWVLWPFKNIDSGAAVVDSKGEVKQEVRIATAPPRLPDSLNETLPVAGIFVLGAACSAGVIYLGRRLEKSK